ncbi:MAG: hypothetical protein BRD50_02375 [Bacteroidetes bacterium SW_11_45_7]|nr:MAG: hypothetical protein BRD50_02375 [Bacteroidetes bacterium SW_11_45_7]
MRYSSTIIIAVLLFMACSSKGPEGTTTEQAKGGDIHADFQPSQAFKDYWYQGKAELNRFELTQGRYGQQRKGEAVMVFVTEDFFTDKQVKYEQGDESKTTSVLKLNFLRRFATGMYDYSMMSSIFTPVELAKYPRTLKVSTSSQDWCGHSYFQLNFRNDNYQLTGHSYFQDEVREDRSLKPALLEDEIWTRLRIAPNTLPTGEIKVIPGTMFDRLKHIELKPLKANARMEAYKGDVFSGNDLKVYKIFYKELNRTLAIVFEEAEPHRIQGWEETYKSGFGSDAREITTRGKRTNTVVTDYWTKNGLQDSTLRQKLGITGFD